MRTHISDDRLSVFDEAIPFLEGAPLEASEGDRFFTPRISEKSASLFEHCALALDVGLAVGRRGLPLIGTGDWNDGVNRVREIGQGESVWLAWFLSTALRIDPRIPKGWGQFEATVRHKTAHYAVFVENPQGVCRGAVSARLDGVEIAERPLRAPLLRDTASG